MPFNLPIFLTWIRVALIPIFVMLYYLPEPILSTVWRDIIAAFIFAAAAFTDWLDGYLARRLKQTSAFGAFLDPVADKLIVAAALLMLVEIDRTSAWVAIIIIGREITISALREWMAQIGAHRSVAVAYIGKLKTAAQMAAIMLLLYAAPIFPNINTLQIGHTLMLIAVALTLWSMFYYLKTAAKQFTTQKNDPTH